LDPGAVRQTQAQAEKQYRELVRDGVTRAPWEQLKGQIYLGSESLSRSTQLE
jgi:hypothetical protein